MNLVSSFYRFRSHVVNRIADFYFRLFLKPLYSFSFNRNGNKFVCDGKIRNTRVSIGGNGNVMLMGNGTLLNKVDVSISGHNNKLIIHDNVRFLEGGRIRIEDNNNSVEIGGNTTLINCFFSSADNNTKLIVGRDCLFSANVILRTSDSHSILDEQGNRINKGKDVVIGNHVWIGNGVTVLKGSVIGNNCVVGTESVVSGQTIQDNSVSVGVPCRTVKCGTNWSIKRIS